MSISALDDLKCTDEEWQKILDGQKEIRRRERKAYRARKAKRKEKFQIMERPRCPGGKSLVLKELKEKQTKGSGDI